MKHQNKKKNQRRLELKKQVQRNKIDSKRMTFKGYGTSRPIHKIPEKNESEADENRRVEILIVEN
jgi:outer membrane protein OmpA-like peptidoglycan-associated protein